MSSSPKTAARSKKNQKHNCFLRCTSKILEGVASLPTHFQRFNKLTHDIKSMFDFKVPNLSAVEVMLWEAHRQLTELINNYPLRSGTTVTDEKNLS